MNDKLPPSLNRFAAELEQAIRRELGSRRYRRLGRVLRARPRLLAGTTVGAAGTGVVLALVLSAAGSSPAFAVSRNRDGSLTRFDAAVAPARSPAANAKLARDGGARAVHVCRGRVRGHLYEQRSPGASRPDTAARLARRGADFILFFFFFFLNYFAASGSPPRSRFTARTDC